MVGSWLNDRTVNHVAKWDEFDLEEKFEDDRAGESDFDAEFRRKAVKVPLF